MRLLLDNRSGIPIYEQIYTQIRGQILSGELAENTPLPSIRGLAKDLQISVITSKKAYDKLEEEGFIYTAPGRGSFVAPKNTDMVREENLKKIEDYLSEIVRLCRINNIDRQELNEMLDLAMEEMI